MSPSRSSTVSPCRSCGAQLDVAAHCRSIFLSFSTERNCPACGARSPLRAVKTQAALRNLISGLVGFAVLVLLAGALSAATGASMSSPYWGFTAAMAGCGLLEAIHLAVLGLEGRGLTAPPRGQGQAPVDRSSPELGARPKRPQAEPAPLCPKCGSRVVASIPPPREPLDRNAWNTRWDGRCSACGHEFVARCSIATGHRGFHKGDNSSIVVRGVESLHFLFDFWDYQPAIAVTIDRAVPATGHDRFELKARESFTVTAEELREIVRQIDGPLKVLLDRRPWSQDTT